MSERTRLEAADNEQKIGIRFSMVASASPPASTAYTPFVASLKTLFSDFVVREQSAVVDGGKPLRLSTFKIPTSDGTGPSSTEEEAIEALENDTPPSGKKTPATLEATIRRVFPPLIGQGDTDQLLSLTETSFSEVEVTSGAPTGDQPAMSSITLQPISEKAVRSQVHREVKTIFANRLISEATDGCIVIRRATQALLREQDRRTRAANPLPFLHFTMYKENLDSGSAMRMIAQQLGISAKSLMFSGTKDKRAVTLQRVACRGLDPQKLLRVNRNQFGRNAKLKVGNIEMRKEGLSLGDLVGNSFEMALRVVKDQRNASGKVDRAALDFAIERLRTFGFPNFFGPQRFGTTSILTSDVGRALLRGAFREAVILVLRSRCDVSPEAAPAVELLQNDDNAAAALDAMPHYCFLERDLLKHLVRSPGDWRGCFTCVPRTTAMLYYHSVQSLVWNLAASKRLNEQGPMPVAGDLVAAEPHDARQPRIGADGNSCVESGPSDEDVGLAVGEKLLAVKRLTEQDIASGAYSIKDVLLTVPGCDPALHYPECASVTRDVFSSIMDELGCNALVTDPHDVAKLYHFHGTYRSLVVVPLDLLADVREVPTFRTPVLETDLEKIYKGWNEERARKRSREEAGVPSETECSAAEGAAVAPHTTVKPPQDDKESVASVSATECTTALAPPTSSSATAVVVLSFGLPPGAYATSLLREVCISVKE